MISLLARFAAKARKKQTRRTTRDALSASRPPHWPRDYTYARARAARSGSGLFPRTSQRAVESTRKRIRRICPGTLCPEQATRFSRCKPAASSHSAQIARSLRVLCAVVDCLAAAFRASSLTILAALIVCGLSHHRSSSEQRSANLRDSPLDKSPAIFLCRSCLWMSWAHCVAQQRLAPTHRVRRSVASPLSTLELHNETS